MKVGFTGTQRGMTQQQKDSVRQVLQTYRPLEFHHGDCVGADLEAHAIAHSLGAFIVVHPPDKTNKRAWCVGRIVNEPAPYLVRNRNIVNSCDMLVAAPDSIIEKIRSGTWATVRYAKKKEMQIVIISQSGVVYKG